MAKKSRPTFQKREKEKARQQRQKDKEARRAEAKERRSNASLRAEGEDPDIAGIRPGPQPLPAQWDYISDGHAGSREASDDKL
ncbi:MAG TPA: hypothetical protein VNN73_21270 [Blastocatellia bacterium]|nr:hypothetical protein [Blastocatellia bacterium]